MAKQNNDQSFAGEMQQNEKTKETVQKDAKKRRERKQGKKQKKKQKRKGKRTYANFVIWLIPLAIAVINILYALYTFFWAKEAGKSNVYQDFAAEKMTDVAMVVIELLLLIGTIFLGIMKKHKWACVMASVIMGVVLYGLCAVNLKVAASINADKEQPATASVEKMLEVLSSLQDQTVYQLQPYILEKDLFMENLEPYCGIPDNNIDQEERPGIMAEIILSYLRSKSTVVSVEDLPNSYETNVLMGDIVYNIFLDLMEEGENSENVSIKNKIYDYALSRLEEAINFRTEADNSLYTAENRRLIGMYNIDAGVCCQRMGELDSASVYYKNAAEWAVKSIYLAAIENDVKAMNEAWDVLNNAAGKLEEVEGSSNGDSVQKVKNIRDAYKIVVDQW